MKRELSKDEKELKEYESLKEEGSKKIFELVNEAKQLDLLSAEMRVDDTSEAIDALKTALLWENSQIEIAQGENENLKKLLDEKNDLSRELSRLSDDTNAVNTFINQTSDYTSEVVQQKIRLESINLFGETDAELHNCPLCSQHIETEIPSIQAINKSLANLSGNLATTLSEKPKLTEYVAKLGLDKEVLKKEIETRQNGIRAIYLEQEQAARQKDLNLRRGIVIGKISLFLESFKMVEENRSLALRIKLLKIKIIELESTINSEEQESRLNSVLNQINTQMTKWAPSLDLEHQDAPIRFDLKKLTIFADTPTKSIPLLNMGSGANWLACHLLIHFALHKHFVKADRPVPRFLVLDQPSQIYFPPEKDINSTGEITESSDETEVKRIYEFIFMVTKELAPNFQVIIADHAKLKFEDFENSIVEEWRNGLKLIPISWINES
jgi:hypothetical protein